MQRIGSSSGTAFTLFVATILLLHWVGCKEKSTWPEKITKAFVVSKDWNLFGDIFEVVPEEGYPISFSSDGGVQTENISGITEWSISSTGHLILSSNSGRGVLEFEWIPEEHIFVGQEIYKDLLRQKLYYYIVIRGVAAGGTSGLAFPQRGGKKR